MHELSSIQQFHSCGNMHSFMYMYFMTQDDLLCSTLFSNCKPTFATMQVLIYDMRSSCPLRVKDHMWVNYARWYCFKLYIQRRFFIFNLWVINSSIVIICRYGSPILNIKWHQTLNSERPKLITSDKHIVRIWDPETVWKFYFSFKIFHLLFSLIYKSTLGI